MATKKKEENPRKIYVVLGAYQCPNKKVWYAKKDEVELLPVEAEPLIYLGKLQLKSEAVKTKGDS
jgi:hypothetical protein